MKMFYLSIGKVRFLVNVIWQICERCGKVLFDFYSCYISKTNVRWNEGFNVKKKKLNPKAARRYK